MGTSTEQDLARELNVPIEEVRDVVNELIERDGRHAVIADQRAAGGPKMGLFPVAIATLTEGAAEEVRDRLQTPH